MRLLADTVITGGEVLHRGWIEVADGAIGAIGAGGAAGPGDRDLGAVTVVPGFVDTHVHGGAGADFSSLARADTAAAVGWHRRHGTTTLVASLVTAAPSDLLAQVRALTQDVDTGVIDGIHLEGPWLAAGRCAW
jgi:N-acetylglucosamine-6-phosphate deacetylase